MIQVPKSCSWTLRVSGSPSESGTVQATEASSECLETILAFSRISARLFSRNSLKSDAPLRSNSASRAPFSRSLASRFMKYDSMSVTGLAFASSASARMDETNQETASDGNPASASLSALSLENSSRSDECGRRFARFLSSSSPVLKSDPRLHLGSAASFANDSAKSADSVAAEPFPRAFSLAKSFERSECEDFETHLDSRTESASSAFSSATADS